MGEGAPQLDPADGGLAPGARLGRYRVVRRLATGGMAELYLARQRGSKGFEKTVALKRVRPHLAGDAEFARLFLNEARLAASLDHSSIAHVLDFGTHGGISFIVMEYVHGPSLLELLRKTAPTPLPREVALSILRDVAAALHYAHERTGPDGQPLGLVHRDVSPSNVLLTYDGEVKLVDFGIAKATALPQSTRSTSLKGKIPYMSPEQAKGQPVDRRTDVFALGTVAFELCTAHRCFVAPGELALLNKVAAASYPKPSSIDPDFCPELAEILDRALAAEPEDRFPTARAFQEAIEDYARRRGLILSNIAVMDSVVESCGREPYPLAPAVEESTGSVPRSSGEGSRTWGWALAGASLAVGVGVGLWWLDRDGVTAPTTEAAPTEARAAARPEPEPEPEPEQPVAEPEPAPKEIPAALAPDVGTVAPEQAPAPKDRPTSRRRRPRRKKSTETASERPSEPPAYLPPSRRSG